MEVFTQQIQIWKKLRPSEFQIFPKHVFWVKFTGGCNTGHSKTMSKIPWSFLDFLSLLNFVKCHWNILKPIARTREIYEHHRTSTKIHEFVPEHPLISYVFLWFPVIFSLKPSQWNSPLHLIPPAFTSLKCWVPKKVRCKRSPEGSWSRILTKLCRSFKGLFFGSYL